MEKTIHTFPSRVLLTHDRPEDFKQLKKRLKELGVDFVCAHHHDEMEERLEAEKFALHIFDVRIYKKGIYGGRINPKGNLKVGGETLIRILCDKNGDRYLYEGEEDEGGELVFKSVCLDQFLRKVHGILEVDQYKKELRELSRELKATQMALEKSQEEMDDFTAIASHDLQEPLRKIRTFASRLENSGNGFTQDQQNYLERLGASTERMQEYIVNLSRYSRIERQGKNFERVDLNLILQQCLRELRPEIASSHAQIEKTVLPVLSGDADQLKLLFLNLLSNALKYVRSGETPKVSIFSRKTENDSWEIFFKDQGLGIPSEVYSKIFQPFERLHGRSQFDGAGMGLAICKKIVRRHGGSLTVSSELEKGSCFVITLPTPKIDS